MRDTADIRSKIDAVYSLEQLSAGNTAVHRLHPMCKLLGTVVFVVTVVSFERHAFGSLIPFAFYPAVLASASETPYSMLFKRVLAALPFCLFIGVSNLFLEKDTAFAVGNIAVSYGAVSFLVIVYRACLCVMAMLILMAVTPFSDLTVQLRRLKVPSIFVIMFEMTYRYIGVLLGEAASMRVAYSLRSPRGSGVDIRHSGSFVGCLLLRSFDRAERIYAAMKCRGYALRAGLGVKRKLRVCDAAYFSGVCLFCVFFRLFDMKAWIAALIEGML